MNARPDTQQHLFKALQKRDRKAFATLYDTYSRVLYGVILKQCGDDARLAEEALQRCFLAIWAGLGDFDPANQRLLAWMLAMVRCELAKNGTANQDTSRIQSGGNTVNDCGALSLLYYRGHTLEEASELLNIPVNELKQKLRAEVTLLRTVNAE